MTNLKQLKIIINDCIECMEASLKDDYNSTDKQITQETIESVKEFFESEA